MKIFTVTGLIFIAIAVAQSSIIRHGSIGTRDDDDSEEVTFVEEDYFEDENGNLVEIWDEPDDETVQETEILLPERVFFHLYTRSNPTSSQEIYIGDNSVLSNSNWDASKPTRIVTHGWVNSQNSDSCTLVRDAYLSQGDYNVILVDWSKISKRSYGYATRRVAVVGGYVGKMIDYLETQGMDISQLTIVGHSLGGHIAGISGYSATNTVGYVVGLDPALPYFWSSGAGSRIAVGDAKYVQVIHTNAGKLGYSSAIGDIDFYPNGGSSQTGCILDLTGSCSHARAYKYFAESIVNGVGFYGQTCNTWREFRKENCNGATTHMGGPQLTTVKDGGSYYLWTARSSPYALGAI